MDAPPDPTFPGSGPTAAACRAHPWADSPLGDPTEWPAALRTLAATVLRARHPMALFWGPERVVLPNDAFREITGTEGPGAPAPGLRASELRFPLWRALGPRVEAALVRGEAAWDEHDSLRVEGPDAIEETHWSWSCTPVPGAEASPEGVLVTVRETTRLVRAETEARRLGERLTRTLESITDAFFTLDRAWRFTFLNDEAERLLERPRGDLLGTMVWDAFPEAIDTASYHEYRKAVAEGVPVRFEQYYPPLERHLSVRAYPSDEGLAVYFQDVTDQRTAEARLARSERLVAMAGRVARLGGWSVDLRSGIVELSHEVCAIHGLPPGSRPKLAEALDFYPPEWRPRIEERFRRCAEEGIPFDLDLQILNTSGEPIWVRSVGEAIRDETGDIVQVQGAFQDIGHQKEAEAELRTSERRFRELAEAMPIGVWTADPDGLVDYQSEALLRFTGRSVRGLSGAGWLDVIHPEDRAQTLEAWDRSTQDGSPYQVEFRIRAADGRYRWHLCRAVPVRDADGKIVKWYGSAVDAHDRLEAERAARALALRLTRTLESITDAFYLLDPDWRFTFLNREAERVLERDREDLMGAVIWDAFPATVGSDLEAAYRRAVAEETSVTLRYRYAPLGRWFDIRAFPSEEGLAVYFRDIDREREAEERLREQAELLDRAQDAILVRELDHSIAFWNAGAERLYGWPREAVLGRKIVGLLYADPAPFHAATRTVLEEGEWSGELEHLREDGSVVTVEGRWSLVRDEEGAPDRILAINTDVTERKKLIAQFLRAQRMESIGTLAGGIAHDLNNVLAPILLSIAYLKEEMEGEEAHEILDTIHQSAERGAEMVNQVLAFARGVDGARVAVDLRRIVQDLERVVRDTFPRSISLRTELPDDLWPISGDATQIHQVLMNLFVNARDAMPDGGVLRLEAANVELDEHYAAMSGEASAGPYLRISVTDTGIGMPPDVREQIFDPFFTTKGVGEGTGLGLSTVAAIVQSHGGLVNVYSESDRGTTFRIYLPARPGGTVARARPPEGLVRGQGQLILVVDDEGSVREITRQTLEAFGFRVLTATDGADAVGIYAQRGEEIAVVLTDLMMPAMDGPATIRALKRMDPAVRIVAASGMGGNGGVARAADAGVEHFLPKPYTAEALLRTLAEILAEEEVG